MAVSRLTPCESFLSLKEFFYNMTWAVLMFWHWRWTSRTHTPSNTNKHTSPFCILSNILRFSLICMQKHTPYFMVSQRLYDAENRTSFRRKMHRPYIFPSPHSISHFKLLFLHYFTTSTFKLLSTLLRKLYNYDWNIDTLWRKLLVYKNY